MKKSFAGLYPYFFDYGGTRLECYLSYSDPDNGPLLLKHALVHGEDIVHMLRTDLAQLIELQAEVVRDAHYEVSKIKGIDEMICGYVFVPEMALAS